MTKCFVPIRNARRLLSGVMGCLLLFSPAASAAASAKDASGSIRFASCSFFESYRLKLVGFQTAGAERALEFKIPEVSWLQREKGWIEAEATVGCGPRAECELYGRGRIQVRHVSLGRGERLKSVSGKFEVTFRDGRKTEGNFTARFIKPSKLPICE